MKIITTFSVGFDHVDLQAAKARGIAVTNTPEVLSFATAETAFTLLLMAARRAGEAGGCLPAVLNAANEEAVAAFVAGVKRGLADHLTPGPADRPAV